MIKRSTTYSRILQGLVWLVLVYVLVAWLASIGYSWTVLFEHRGQSAFHSEVALTADSAAFTFSSIRNREFEGKPLPAVGDTLVALQTTRLDSAVLVTKDKLDLVDRVFDLPHPPEDTVQVTFGSARGRRQVEMIYVPVGFISLMIPLAVLGGLPLPFFLVSIWAMIKQGGNPGVRVLTLLLLSLSVLFFISLESMSYGMRAGALGLSLDNVQGIKLPSFNTPLLMFSSLGTGFWLHLAFLFPSPHELLKKRSWLVYVLAYGVTLPFTFTVFRTVENLTVAPGNLDSTLWLLGLSTLVSTAQLVGGGVLLLVRGTGAENPVEKRQVRVLLKSVGLGLALILVFSTFMAVAVLQENPSQVLLGLSFLFILLSMMLIPLGFAYSFSKYRLLEVEGRLKRGVTFLLTSGGLLLVVFLVLFFGGNLLIKHLDMESRSSMVFITLVLALAYIPLHNWLQSRLERRIFRTRWRLREMLESFLATTARYTERTALWEAFGEKLKENIGVKTMHVLLLDPDHRRFLRPDGVPAELPADTSLQRELERRPRPLALEELRASRQVEVKSEEQHWFDEHDVSVLLPILVHGEPVGALALGFEYGYDEIKADELDILLSITSRVALENENLRLIEENLEKRRLEEQLALARQVQERFLPTELPETPGLDLAAECRFSLEVAGDMYDVIPLSRDRTLLAIGDVAGKGAGAAMIMANLQASLRALAETDLSLEAVLTRMNTLVARATSSEQFVTFFAAIYNPAKQTLTCVNAGHNAPLLIRTDGEVEALTDGGLLLGVMDDAEYTAFTTTFGEGGLLVAFTDGVSEAENGQGDMYGEERIKDLAKTECNLDARSLMHALQDDVDRFRGDVPLGDDVTLLVVKRR